MNQDKKSLPNRSLHTSWIELSRSNFHQNLLSFRNIADSSSSKLGLVVKGNAYGHGFSEIAGLAFGRVDTFFVIDPADAIELRKMELDGSQTNSQILVLGNYCRSHFLQLAELGIELAVDPERFLQELSGEPLSLSITAPLRVHLHLDSGLSREGCTPQEIGQLSKAIDKLKDVEIVGILTHFANTEDVTDHAFAHNQIKNFEDGCSEVRRAIGDNKYQKLLRHTAATGAALALENSRLDCLRIGIGGFGFWPSAEAKLSAKITLGVLPILKPVLSWRVASQVIKTLPAGSDVGYGCTYRCRRTTRTAVFPVGYFDGYPRLLTDRAYVLISGKRCPVIGRVMMNHIVVDVTDLSPTEETLVATLVGKDGSETITMEQIANWSDTIHYEASTRIGAHLPRYVLP